MKRCRRILLCTLLPVLLASSCSTQRMKGTPFYTGEYKTPQGPVEDRVNLWPLAYYRKPALSVLWPLVEKSDTHFAIFPLLSIYGLDREAGREVSVLWPLSNFDTINQEHRIANVYWDDDRIVVFPLYWKTPEVHTLFPLYWKSKNRFWLACGLFNWQNAPDFQPGEFHKGWHLFPLYGHYESKDGGKSSSFVLWPLMNYAKDGDGTRKRFLPFFARVDSPAHSEFYSLPWFSQRERGRLKSWVVPPLLSIGFPQDGSFYCPLFGWGGGKDGFGYVLPIGLRTSNSDGGRSWYSWLGHIRRDPKGALQSYALFPLLWFRNVAERSLYTPLFGWTPAKDGDPDVAWIFPLGARVKDADGTRLLTPLWFQKNTGDELKWYSLMPFFFRDVERDRLFTPLYGHTTDKQGRLDYAYLLPLAGRMPTEDGGSMWISPLWFQTRDAHGGVASQTLLPLFHRRPREGAFYTPLFGWNRGRGTRPGLFYASPFLIRSPNEIGGSTWISPLYCRGSDKAGKEVWSLLVPFYFKNADLFFTPLYGRYHSSISKVTLRYLTPLIHWWKNGETGARGFRFFPFVSHTTFTGNDDFTTRYLLLGKIWKKAEQSGSSFIPLYSYTDHGKPADTPDLTQYSRTGSSFWCLPWLMRKNITTVSPVDRNQPVATVKRERYNGLFPLWDNESVRTETPGEGTVHEQEDGSIGWFLYDRKREADYRAGAEEPDDEYVRHRVLWRLYHYERKNKDVSVDVFPGITVDRKEDGARKFSILWRLCRNQTLADGTRKLDILFIPILR